MQIKRILCILICISVVMLNFSGFTYANNDATSKILNEAYDYPIKKGTPEWFELTTIHKKIEACQIPTDILERLSTEALIETVKNYPLGINLYAYDSLDMGYEKVKSQFNGLAELEKRLLEETPKSCLLLAEFTNQSTAKGEEAEFEDYFISAISMCIYNNVVSKIDVETEETSVVRGTDTYVYTPNGTQVSATYQRNWLDVYEDSLGRVTELGTMAAHEEVQKTYPSVTYVDGYDISPKYNCHSYAWYSTSPNNAYWISDPSNYILDGSYVEASYYHVGAKILYGTPGDLPEHSAIVSAVSENHLTYVTSKWGCAGVYRHLYYDCPYTSGIKKYHENQ